MLKKISFLLAISLFCTSSLLAQTDKPKDPKLWTPEDIINTEYLSNPVFSPDASMVVWSKRVPVKKKDKFISNLYLTRLNVKEDGKYITTQLTQGEENDYNPVFSEDGKAIYFLSSRDKGKKLWKLSLYGGEAEEVEEFENGISSLQLKDKNTLLFTSNDGKTLYDQQAEERKDDVEVIEDSLHWQPSHIYSFDLDKKQTTRITSNEKPIGSFKVSHNGDWLYYTMTRSLSYGADAQKDPYSYLINLNTNSQKQILKDFEFPVGRVQFTADDSGFYFTSDYASDPEWNGAGITELYFFDIASAKATKVNLDWELGLGGGYTLSGKDVVASLANKATMKLAYYTKKGTSWSKSDIDLGEKNNHVSVDAIADDGSKILYTWSTASKLPEYFVADLKKNKISNETVFISLNKKLKDKYLPKSEIITWKGYNDDEVTGILYYPKDYEPGKKYPFMLNIHGGPSSQDIDEWSGSWAYYPSILVQKNMFVLMPNYHGSTNHGLEYAEAIKGNYYEPELEDITKAIDKLAAEGKIDRDQMGTMGWSNGAIISTMLTVKYPDMFKVAAPGAGDVNWTSDYGTCQFGVSFDQSYFGGAPWDDTDDLPYNTNYLIKSPLFEIEKIKTPTIIFHGSEDRAVPRDQGWEYYRGLQQVGKTPVKFLWFPGQPHGLGKITHQLRKMKEEIAWIDTYLFNKKPDTNEALKEDSPLAAMLKLDEAAMDKGLFGNFKNNKLLPEVVLLKKDSISLGRFEVTNAQFRAFKPDFTFEAGKENYPVVTDKASAEAYVTWLSQQTGATYRLPNAKEAESLQLKAAKAAKDQNNLNHWAGYEITPEDAALLEEKVSTLTHSLLWPVGSSKAVELGNATVYDLGGNVAEYSQNGTYDYSAYDYADPFNPKPVNSKHTGFRVVKE
ncbi:MULTISPECIES: prolyl oligopeptidase family serine peptidase [unclassified Leeuwenhoekiella]|uniref:S9 family peptidase n=1 Tax=unclassified Leeuwenhoekiella TaxID=2615029 RepID=UPI000C427FB9|nr:MULTISPECIES: prolyl oligopeptidase family serine peptidase [unclassified Leeuwenhoekiella]MAW94459.1 peptidase S9 [Leeuwenhoekiella sp.]MAW96955.1 peptidase S9 [Leeuwenhoekiella sp.]MBA81137.1 peptidase S9 [Leeuwenhoekiella sp.]|tara:strand:- start:45864 stop:48566 length:2703 start_codon:yes stop_codon:yes gene_type:complete